MHCSRDPNDLICCVSHDDQAGFVLLNAVFELRALDGCPQLIQLSVDFEFLGRGFDGHERRDPDDGGRCDERDDLLQCVSTREHCCVPFALAG